MHDEIIRVLVADDHALFRQALRAVLAEEPDLELVGEAGDGTEAVTLAAELAPDVVLMDVRMPKLAGIDAARQIATELPAAKIVMLTVSDDEADLFEAIKAGASGYLLKEVDPSEIAQAVRQIHAGHSLLSPVVASKLVSEFAAISKRAEEKATRPNITGRELEVLQFAADGLTNRQIGRRLGISENTVKNHIRNILEKLHLHSRMEAVLYAVREELIDLEKDT
ncbi:MAG TPA: response regulator transcription factor [Actinomycetota bacterium]|jgi:two-component system NarL family response regulator|nr:response regulator transcription factor [Actinomycetota bacterium]